MGIISQSKSLVVVFWVHSCVLLSIIVAARMFGWVLAVAYFSVHMRE